MKVAVKTIENKAAGDVTLDDAIFGVDVKPEIVTEENVASVVEANKEETTSAIETKNIEEAPVEETAKEDQQSESPSEKK